MKTIRRLFYSEVIASVALVTLGFVTLFYFFDFVEELQAVGKHSATGYTVLKALIFVTFMMPSHIYELLPITVLIGTIFVMARLAQSSEFTILRTSGLGPWRALRTLSMLGMVFVIFTFAVGDYVAPLADKTGQLLKARYQGRITVGKTGAWLKETQLYGHYSVNVGALAPDGSMQNVRIFEFDNQGYLVSMTQGQTARFGAHDDWLLENVDRTEFASMDEAASRVDRALLAQFRWPTQISAEMVSAAVLRPERMGTIDLFQYTRHLQANGQSSQKYQIQFWKKVFYPLSCLVMVVLALPFAYLHFRSGSVATYVFGGVMAGISFVLLNNVLGDLGALQGWQPWFTAALPGLIYSAISLAAFSWLVLRR
ncbi:MAG: LPS export ABC transporter permease LptG [Burkholderiales bacterium]|nr:LPS export ABC transporter permease LptG [Burkholderiales bacterium]MBK9345724.1 LPS export ABC transporter permease LptG [Burkholderiales bacterium]